MPNFKSTNPSISVVIPTYNSAETLELTLKSLIKQKYRGELEIIIVDDNSTDNTSEIIKKYGAKHLRHNTNLGLGKSVNDGINISNYDYVCVLHEDILIPYEEWLNKMISYLALNDDVALVTSPSIVPEFIWKQWGFWEKALFAWEIVWSERESKTNNPREIEYSSIKNDVIKKKIFQELGGFDWKTFRVACEDVDLSFRLRKKGYKLISLPIPTYHIHSKSAKGLHAILFQKNPRLSEGQGVLFRRYGFNYKSLNNQIFKTLAIIALFLPFQIIQALSLIYILGILFSNSYFAYKVLKDPKVYLIIPPIKMVDYLLNVFYFWRGFLTGKQKK